MLTYSAGLFLQQRRFTTAILRGTSNGTGIGLLEAFDLDQPATSELANISTLGLVQPDDDRMIGGFMLGNGTGSAKVMIRELGPSLTKAGVPNALIDPTLELHDGQGALISANDNWSQDPAAAALIQATGLAPTNLFEAAILTTIPPRAHTAIVADKQGRIGVGLVEVYRIP